MTGAEEVSGTLIPRSSMTDSNNIIHNFSITSSNSDILDNNIDLGIYLDIVSMDSELSDKSFKWSLYKNNKELVSGNFLGKKTGDTIKISSTQTLDYAGNLYDTSTFKMLDLDACVSYFVDNLGKDEDNATAFCNGTGYGTPRNPFKLKDDFNSFYISQFADDLISNNIISIEKYPVGKLIYEYFDTSTYQMLDQSKCVTLLNNIMGSGEGDYYCDDKIASIIADLNGVTNDLISQNIVSVERKKEEYYVLDSCLTQYTEAQCTLDYDDDNNKYGLIEMLLNNEITTTDLITNNVIISNLVNDKYESTNDYTLYIWIDGNMDNPYSMFKSARNFTFKLYADATQVGGASGE